MAVLWWGKKKFDNIFSQFDRAQFPGFQLWHCWLDVRVSSRL